MEVKTTPLIALTFPICIFSVQKRKQKLSRKRKKKLQIRMSSRTLNSTQSSTGQFNNKFRFQIKLAQKAFHPLVPKIHYRGEHINFCSWILRYPGSHLLLTQRFWCHPLQHLPKSSPWLCLCSLETIQITIPCLLPMNATFRAVATKTTECENLTTLLSCLKSTLLFSMGAA